MKVVGSSQSPDKENFSLLREIDSHFKGEGLLLGNFTDPLYLRRVLADCLVSGNLTVSVTMALRTIVLDNQKVNLFNVEIKI